MKRCLHSLVVAFGLSAASAFADTDSEAVRWIQTQLIPVKTVVAGSGLEDLQPLKPLIGDARIVSLGESTHGSKEIFQMKHRMLEFLAKEMGFTIFSIEASMPEAYRLNDYVLHGEGDPSALIAGMYFWTWQTEEVRAMVEWMKSYNETAERKLQFTGFDMQTPDVAMTHALSWLQQHAPDRHAEARELYEQAKKIQFGISGRGGDFGVATATFPVAEAAGKQVKLSGWIKTEQVTDGFAGLWWRVDGPQGTMAFNNMADQSVKGTTDWTRYEFELKVPAEAVNINYGVLLPGKGTAWFDGLQVELDGKAFASDLIDLDFESDHLRGLITISRSRYTVTLDKQHAKSGKQSLKIDYRPSTSEDELTDARKQQITQQMQSLVEEMPQFAASQPPDPDAAWAIQNARVAYQSIAMRTGEVQRDACMARNVEWIAGQNPDAKLVLWAHNGHVNRFGMMMGVHLDKKYGDAHRPIGFATARGKYQAIKPGKGLSVHDLQEPATGSVEEAFAQVGQPRFILDLRPVEPDHAVAEILAKPALFRSIGALAQEQQFFPVNLQRGFDAVIYIEQTSAAEPIGGRPSLN